MQALRHSTFPYIPAQTKHADGRARFHLCLRLDSGSHLAMSTWTLSGIPRSRRSLSGAVPNGEGSLRLLASLDQSLSLRALATGARQRFLIYKEITWPWEDLQPYWQVLAP